MRLAKKNGTKRTGEDHVQEIKENKRSPDMENVNSQKECEEKSFKFLFFTYVQIIDVYIQHSWVNTLF